jgi:hypothetical protein
MFTPLPGGGRSAAASDDDDRKVLSFPDESISADWKVESRSDGLRSAASGSSTALVVRPSSQLAPSCSATTSTGLVAACAPPEFNGHSSQWLNTEEMEKALGTAPGFMSRPAHLNALAFKCGDESCPSRQCTLLLDEINVYQLRNEWALQMKEEGVYGEAAKAAVMRTLVAHCLTGQAARCFFEKVEVSIMNRSGVKAKVHLCAKTWSIVVPGMGQSTFVKLMAKVPASIQQERLYSTDSGSIAPLHLRFTQGSTGSSSTKKKPKGEGEKFAMLQAT